MTRSLTLRREALTALAEADLDAVGGAAWSAAGFTCPVADCSRYLTIRGRYECSTFPLC